MKKTTLYKVMTSDYGKPYRTKIYIYKKCAFNFFQKAKNEKKYMALITSWTGNEDDIPYISHYDWRYVMGYDTATENLIKKGLI